MDISNNVSNLKFERLQQSLAKSASLNQNGSEDIFNQNITDGERPTINIADFFNWRLRRRQSGRIIFDSPD